MLEGVLGSLAAKILAGVLGVAGIAGGLGAAGVLPGVPGIGGSAPEVEVAATAGDTTVSTSSALPVDLAGLPVGSEAAGVMALIEQAQAAADNAGAAASLCLDAATTQVSGLVASIAGLTDPAQLQSLLGKVAAVGTQAQSCADQATAMGTTAVDKAREASQAAGALDSAGLGDLGGLIDSEDILGQILAAALGAGDAAAAAEDLALGIVNQVITTVGALLPGLGDGGLPIPALGDGGLPIPGLGDGGLPIPGLGDGGLPIPSRPG